MDSQEIGGLCTLRSDGLKEASLPEVEISQCPLRLKEVAANLIVQIALNGRDTPESLADGKVIGGRFVRRDQPLIEAFRLARIDDISSTLRIQDLDLDQIFPRRLIATHLCATAGASGRDAMRLLLVSTEVWPKEKAASNAPLANYEFNPNNFWSWIDLGTAFSQTGNFDDAIMHWKTAVCLWPRGGKMYAARLVERVASAARDNSSDRAAQDLWRSVTNDAITHWCRDLGVELSEAALAD